MIHYSLKAQKNVILNSPIDHDDTFAEYFVLLNQNYEEQKCYFIVFAKPLY